MPAFGDDQLVAVIHNRTHIIVVHRHLRQCSKHIQLGKGGGGVLHPKNLSGKVLQQILKQLALQGQKALAGTKDLAFQLF